MPRPLADSRPPPESDNMSDPADYTKRPSGCGELAGNPVMWDVRRARDFATDTVTDPYAGAAPMSV